MNARYYFPPRWVPRNDLPAAMPLREQLRTQLEDRQEFATHEDNLASIGRSAPIADLRTAVEGAVWLQEGTDPEFRQQINHD